jgi:hypothetical protein
MLRILSKSQLGMLAVIASINLVAQVPEHIRASIDGVTGARGAYSPDDGVYKVVLPREEAAIVYDYQKLSPGLGLNSWVAFKPGTHNDAILTGQFLLLEDEVDSVVTAALAGGLNVTGLASSSVFDGPHLKSLDVTGTGTFDDLAAASRKCLDEIQRVRKMNIRPKAPAPDTPIDSSIDSGPLDAALSMKGEVIGGVYKAAVGARAVLHGEEIGREMGASTWVSIAGSNDRAVAHGDFVARTDDLQRLLRALRAKKISIISIRNHTVGEQPQSIFVHFRAEGSAVELARAIRYALDSQTG